MTMTVIEHIELASAQSSITFSSIPQTYTDLYLVVSGRTSNSGVTGLYFTLNGSSSNFSGRYLQGNGAGVGSGTIQRWIGTVADAQLTANTFSNQAVYLPNYTAAASKSFSVDSVTETNASTSFQDIGAGLWADNSAITSIVIAPSAGNLVQYSSATLYGVLAGSDGVTSVS